MKISALRWHPETLVCSKRGHVTPAADVARLRPQDSGLGVDLADGRRLARCLRCDVWIACHPPEHPARGTLPVLEDIVLPRRGRALRDAIVLRLIAIDRAIHALLFGILAAALLTLDIELGPLQAGAGRLQRSIQDSLRTTGQTRGLAGTARILERIGGLRRGAITVLLATALAYCVVEAVEAAGLWRERRWAEYLTALATAGFLPFEIDELAKRTTVLRVGALVVNLAVLGYLVWGKRLFGIRGGARVERGIEARVHFAPGTVGTPPRACGYRRP